MSRYPRALQSDANRECQTPRSGLWQQTRLENDRCNGDIANIDGRLVCSDNGEYVKRTDRMHGDRYTSGGEGDYSDTQRHDDYGYRFDHGYNDQQPYGDPYANNRPYGEPYGDRRYDDRGYAGDDVLPRGRLIRRLERQGYYGAHDLRPVRWGDDWRALAIWRGHRVVVRLNPHNGRVIAARYI